MRWQFRSGNSSQFSRCWNLIKTWIQGVNSQRYYLSSGLRSKRTNSQNLNTYSCYVRNQKQATFLNDTVTYNVHHTYCFRIENFTQLELMGRKIIAKRYVFENTPWLSSLELVEWWTRKNVSFKLNYSWCNLIKLLALNFYTNIMSMIASMSNIASKSTRKYEPNHFLRTLIIRCDRNSIVT